MIGRRAAAAGIATKLGNHSFRATGTRPIPRMAARSKTPQRWRNPALTHTTQLYDRRRDELTLDEIERIGI